MAGGTTGVSGKETPKSLEGGGNEGGGSLTGGGETLGGGSLTGDGETLGGEEAAGEEEES